MANGGDPNHVLTGMILQVGGWLKFVFNIISADCMVGNFQGGGSTTNQPLHLLCLVWFVHRVHIHVRVHSGGFQGWCDSCFSQWLFFGIVWSNYSDLTRPHPKWWFSKGNPLISGKSRLVKYYNLARIVIHRFLGGGFKHFLFSPLPGEMIQFDEHIFQMGWFNHQLVLLFYTVITLPKTNMLHHFAIFCP